MEQVILSIDQGTSSCRAVIFSIDGRVVAKSQQSFQQFYPQSGYVEHDANEIWQKTLAVCRNAIKEAKVSANKISAIGITNQRETTVVWDKKTGQPLAPAIVWQDRRTMDYCQQLKDEGHEALVQAKTGLLLDPYFSGSKLRYLLQHIPNSAELIKAKRLAFGTVDSFLLWQLTKGNVHATDVSNAARTLLFNIHDGKWDDELLALFAIDSSVLPTVYPSSHCFGETAAEWFNAAIPICGIAGDQHAALIGQACYQDGSVKATLGSGCFVMQQLGLKPAKPCKEVLTTIAYQFDDQPHYALEGSIFNAGTTVKWLHEELQIIDAPAETEALAASLSSNDGVYLIPAFTGLGAPHWRSDLRGALSGLQRNSSKAHIARAALEAVAYQLRDLFSYLNPLGDSNLMVKIDGGMAINDWLLQFISDQLQQPVARAKNQEATALGAAWCAAIGLGVLSVEDTAKLWQSSRVFEPKQASGAADEAYAGWCQALNRLKS